MGRQRTPEPVDEPFTFEPDSRGGVTVMRDGHPQSHVHLSNPEVLEFEYMQHFALVLNAISPSPPAPMGVTHIGGAGLTLPRYVDATRPGSPQIVLEPDVALTEAVRREIPLPRQHRIRVRATDGVSGVKALKDSSADVVVLDAFAEGRVPAALVAPPFLADLVRVLAPGGVFLANLSDEPDLRWVARVAATVREQLPHVVLIGAQEVLKGRRFGNVVLAAAQRPDVLPVEAIQRLAARAMFPTGVRHGASLERILTAAQPFTMGTATPSPVPPQLGSWRVR